MAQTPENLITFEGTVEEFNTKVKEHNGLVVVKFGSTTCMPCRRVRQLLPGIARDNQEVLFMNIEVDQKDEFKEPYNITSVPNIKYFKGVDESGKPIEVASVIGADIPAIKAKVAQFK